MNLEPTLEKFGMDTMNIPCSRWDKINGAKGKRGETLDKIQPIAFWYTNCGLEYFNWESDCQQGKTDYISLCRQWRDENRTRELPSA